MTFSLEVKTPAEIAAEVNADRLETARLECRRRILAVANLDAQMNLASASSAGLLTAEQATTYTAGLQWVAAMRAAWRTLGTVADVTEDVHWPPIPVGVPELAALY